MDQNVVQVEILGGLFAPGERPAGARDVRRRLVVKPERVTATRKTEDGDADSSQGDAVTAHGENSSPGLIRRWLLGVLRLLGMIRSGESFHFAQDDSSITAVHNAGRRSTFFVVIVSLVEGIASPEVQ